VGDPDRRIGARAQVWFLPPAYLHPTARSNSAIARFDVVA
jgi:hypothetical protein